MKTVYHYPENISVFKEKVLQWAASKEVACFLDSNQYSDRYSAFDTLIAADVLHEVDSYKDEGFKKLEFFLSQYNCWIPGFLSYDLKNELEDLRSENPDHLQFPDLFFFVPRHLIIIRENVVEIQSPDAADLARLIEKEMVRDVPILFKGSVKSRFSKASYIDTVHQIKRHIARGDIYEVNLCQEFYATDAQLDPVTAFRLLNKLSPAPFSVFFKLRKQFIISATPERFLCRRDNKLISQPIKGTSARGGDAETDKHLKDELKNNEKERSENVMIVDLVRNDLTRCAIPGTVEVEELFGIYTFRHVHQMISTVVCQADPSLQNAEIVKRTFPMGSMTGAPKVSAMELIEQYELTKRGIFSGAVGYFAPAGDFDFNVVIRTLLYNEENGYLSFQAGSAITFASDASKEYEECILKAKAIFSILNQSIEC